MALTAAITAGGVVGQSAYAANRANKAAKDQKSALEADARTQQNFEKALIDRLTKEESSVDKTEEASRARERQRARAAGAVGRSDTIRTGSLGLTDSALGQVKTLLGR